jgi:hypothetical protein
MRKPLLGLAALVLTGLLSSCNQEPYKKETEIKVEGYRPIYLSHEEIVLTPLRFSASNAT